MRKTSVLLITLVTIIILAVVYNNVNSDELYSHGRYLLASVPHKDLLPFDSSDYWGTLFVTLGLLIAASGGIGGGGMLVPLLILVYGFSPKHAIALSNFCIVGSSITNMVMNLSKRHPIADRPLVDWDLILVMEPLTMAGAVVGAFVSKMLPDWMLVISLVFLLAFTTWTTLEKGLSQYRKESKAFADEARSELIKAQEKEVEMSENLGLLDEEKYVSADDEESPGARLLSVEEAYVDPELAALLKAESTTPMDKVVILSTMVAVVIVLNLLKGGGGSFPSPVGIKCGSYGYWGMTLLVFVWVLAISLWMRDILIDKWRTKTRLRYRYIEGDVEWNPTNTVLYPCICFFAGFFAGMFGVGGGIVKGPLMLQMGVHPLVASATCAVMIMFTSVAATTMFIAFGTLTWDYAWFLFVVGLLATVVGQYGVSYLVVKYRRVSLVSLSIGAVVAISTVLMAVQSVFSLVDAEHSESNSLCSNK